MFVLAHLSDPHLGLPAPRMAELAGKRVLGYINWRSSRTGRHLAHVLDSVVADVLMQNPDHIAVTGDLINIAIEAEFAPARQWLCALGPAEDVTLVPGNHDAYVRRAQRHHGIHWGDYMRGDGIGMAAPIEQVLPFPFVRRRGPVALVGLSTAVPTGPFMATGRLGAAQIMRLSDELAHLRREGLFRVVLLHHPPVDVRRNRFTRLIDGDGLARVIAEHGAELVLHGHEHVHSLVWMKGPDGLVPAVGVPSASSSLASNRDPAAYNLYRISGAPGTWRCEAVSRGLQRGHNGIAKTATRILAGTP